MKIINKKVALLKLKEGLPVGFQTDTLPAIGCFPEFSDVIYKYKNRNKNKALILMCADISQSLNYVHTSAKEDFKRLAEKYWPGPLTLVIPVSEELNLKITSNDNTLGIRIPNLSSALSFIKETGPLATSSANISGQQTSKTAKDIANDLPNLDLLGPIPWDKCSGKASTVISWERKDYWQIIRQGEISL